MAELRLNRTEAVDGCLPMVCMVCGDRATVRATKRFWRNTQMPILLPGVIVRRGEWVPVDVPFCDRHRNLFLRPLWMVLGGFGGLFLVGLLVFGLAALGMFGGLAAAAGTNNAGAGAAVVVAVMLGGGFLLFAAFIGLIVGVLVVNHRLIRPVAFDDRTITLCNVSDGFVAAMNRRRDRIQDVDVGDLWKDRLARPGRAPADDADVLDAEPAEEPGDSGRLAPRVGAAARGANGPQSEPPSSGFSYYGLIAVIFLGLFAFPCGLLSLIAPPAAWALLAYGVAVWLGGTVWMLVLAASDGRLGLSLIPFYSAAYAFARPARAGLPLTAKALGCIFVGAAAVILIQSGGGGLLPAPPPAPAPLVLPAGKEPESPTKLDGLIACWRLDEGDGVRAADGSGHGLDGVVQGARRAPGVKGNSLYFNGKGDCVDYGESPKFNFGPGQAFTYAGWVQTRSRNCAIVSQRNSTEEAAAIDLVVRDGQPDWYVRDDRVGWFQRGEVRGKKPINDGKWHHFAGTRMTDGRVELFIDGVSQGQAGGPQVAGSITTDLRFLGTERYWVQVRWYEYPHLEGYLDEVCVYDRALTPDEIKALAGP